MSETKHIVVRGHQRRGSVSLFAGPVVSHGLARCGRKWSTSLLVFLDIISHMYQCKFRCGVGVGVGVDILT